MWGLTISKIKVSDIKYELFKIITLDEINLANTFKLYLVEIHSIVFKVYKIKLFKKTGM